MAPGTKRDFERAIQSYDAAVDGCDRNNKEACAKAFYERGEAKRKHRHFFEALEDLNASLGLNPTLAQALASRGGVKRQLGQYPAAISDYNESMQSLGSKDPEVLREILVGRAAAKRAMGNLTEAMVDVNHAISLGQKNPFTMQLRGELQRKLGKHEAALQDYDAALKLNPCYVPALAGRAAAQRTLGKFQEAIKDFTAGLSLSPSDANMLADRGYTKFQMGLPDDAMEDYTQALKIDPEHRFAKWALNQLEVKAEQGAVFLRRSVTIEGFARTALNTRYVERREEKRLVNCRETWWAEDEQHFFFWSEEEHRWKASLSGYLEKIRAGGKFGVASAPEGRDLLDDKSPKKNWYEWDGLKWEVQPKVSISTLGPANKQLRIVTLAGFQGGALNSEYDELRESMYCVNYRETYWSVDREYFLFWCSKDARWKGSRRQDLQKIQEGRSPAIIAAPAKQDLLRGTYLKGWREFQSGKGDWVLLQDAGVVALSSCRPDDSNP